MGRRILKKEPKPPQPSCMLVVQPFVRLHGKAVLRDHGDTVDAPTGGATQRDKKVGRILEMALIHWAVLHESPMSQIENTLHADLP